MPPKEKYTDPDLRDEVKEEIHQGDKGGAPGQWSARKAQMMASEYKKRGGGYNTDKKDQDESQKHLTKWGEEDWQTKEGSGDAKQDDGSEKRYLPKKAWDKMSEQEKEETDEKKLEESRKGKQHVQNTNKAKESRKEASEDEKNNKKQANEEEDGGEEEEEDEEEENGDDSGQEEDENEEEYKGDDTGEEEEEEAEEEEKDEENNAATEDDNTDTAAQAGQKRTRSSSSNTPSKKQKSNSRSSTKKETASNKNNSDSSRGSAGSADRLPKKGQKVQWHSLPGYVSGEVVEVVYEEKEVDGKKVKGAEGDPRIVLKSDSSGKIAVHKPEAVYFD